MADKFGAAHRQLIKDTNDGKVAPATSRPTTSIQTGGRETTVVGSDDKSALYKGLINLGSEVVGTIAKRKQERDFVTGYNNGLEEGYAENERNPIMDKLFGPSATLRGAQKRIVENDSRRWTQARMKSLEDDMMAFDEDGYQTELNDQLAATLEEHDDPDIKLQISQHAAKNFQTLARNHTQARQMWIADSSQRAVEDSINQAALGVRNAQKYGDAKTQLEAMKEAEDMFDQPLDMSPEAWLETISRVAMENLSAGDPLAYDMAEKKGIIAMMRPDDQRKLESAYSIFDMKNGSKFYTDQQALVNRIDKGMSTDTDLVNFKRMYPEQGDDLNKLRKYKYDTDAELAEIARQKRLTIEELESGDIAYTARTPKEQREAVTTKFNDLANAGLTAIRADLFEAGEYDGDMQAEFTPEQRMDYMLDNPMEFAQTWAQHPEVKTPMVQNLMTSMISDLRREDLDEDGIEVLTRRYAALKQFQSLDGGNFHNQFRSEEDASMYAAYSYLVADAGWNPINAVREMRTVLDKDPINLGDYKDVIEDNLSELEDSFLDQSPESQGWMGLYNKTPDNEQVFNYELQTRLENAMKIFKGDMSKALPAAQAAMRRNGLVSNGQFIPNGRKLQIKGGSLEDFVRGLNANEEMRTQITNSGNGFAPDVDYTSLELSVNPFSYKTVIMHGRHEKTGQPIAISLNLPQHMEHFSTYGFNTFTGYNPYIADKDERRRAFLRNNKLMRGYTTIGKAVGQATGLSREAPHEK